MMDHPTTTRFFMEKLHFYLPDFIMNPLIEFTVSHGKLVTLSLMTGILGLAEAVASVSATEVNAWESVTFKGFLIAVIIYLVRESSLERKGYQKKSEEREDIVVKVVEENTAMSSALLAETKRQTAFFDGVSADVVKSALRTPAPNLNQH